MQVDTKTLVSISEANQNFSKVARLVDQFGSAVILKNNSPRYIITQFDRAENAGSASDSDIASVSNQIISRNKKVYRELAK